MKKSKTTKRSENKPKYRYWLKVGMYCVFFYAIASLIPIGLILYFDAKPPDLVVINKSSSEVDAENWIFPCDYTENDGIQTYCLRYKGKGSSYIGGDFVEFENEMVVSSPEIDFSQYVNTEIEQVNGRIVEERTACYPAGCAQLSRGSSYLIEVESIELK